MNRSVVLTVLALALCATGVRAGGFAGGEPASYDATIYVDGAAAQGGDGSEAKPLASLRDGVARVQKSLKEGRSTKLLVKPGVYRESLPTIGCWMKGDDGSQNENVKFQDAWLRVDRWGDKGEVVISGAGGWWTVAGNPDLGQLTDPKQQPVDFSIWQAADGTWQLWSCIRNTKIGGRTRLFHRWEGKQLTDTDWKPMGIALRADLNVGEESVQSPYVFKDGGEPLRHPISPCPIYDVGGNEAGSGSYVLFIHNHDGHYKNYGPTDTNFHRRPVHLVPGRFVAGADQPVWFDEPKLFMDHDGTSLGKPGTEGIQDLALYSSLTVRNGKAVLWYPDRKFFLLGREIGSTWLAPKREGGLHASKDKATSPFLHIPGPNPILMCGTPGAWDESVIEACDIIKEDRTYYLFYHGHSFSSKGESGYRIGLATAPHPLGPWTKHGDRPVLDLGPKGSWDGRDVACAAIVKEGPERFLMWYSGSSRPSVQKPGQTSTWDVGLATASRLEGPWTKHAANPLIKDFGYVGGALKHEGQYRLYTENPIGSIANDYGPLALATAVSPEGPWTLWKDNPVLPGGTPGAWDDGGCSEAKVTFWGGLYHLFYGGAKEYKPRMKTRESIGYATSADGLRFTRHPANPVAAREDEPNVAAFSEVHTLVEPPFIYAYHTLRYIHPRLVTRAAGRTSVLEDLGVQVFVMRRPFQFEMPLLNVTGIKPGGISDLSDCPPLCITHLGHANISVRSDLSVYATKHQGIRIRARGSADGLRYEENNDQVFDVGSDSKMPGEFALKLDPKMKFIKILVENLDPENPCRNVSIKASVGG